MNNIRLLLLTGIIMVCSIISCDDDIPQAGSEVQIEQRSSDYEDDWLNELRLNLIDNEAIYEYSIHDVQYGIESLYNILGTKGPCQLKNGMNFSQEMSFTSNNGKLDQNQIRSLSELIGNSMIEYYEETSPGIMMMDVSLEELDDNIVKYNIDYFTGEIDEPIYESGYGLSCNEDAFDIDDCWISTYGDYDYEFFDPSGYGGGPCGEPDDSTSAQEEVEAIIQNDIPRYIRGKKGAIIGEVKYTNQEYASLNLNDGILNEFLDEYGNCSSLGLDYKDENDIEEELEYNANELNCTICALKDYLLSICPEGKVVCDINLYGDLLSSGAWQWQGSVHFCDAEFVIIEADEYDPPVPGPGPNPSSGAPIMILGSNSFTKI